MTVDLSIQTHGPKPSHLVAQVITGDYWAAIEAKSIGHIRLRGPPKASQESSQLSTDLPRSELLPWGRYRRDNATRTGQRARAVAVVGQEPLARSTRKRCRLHAANTSGCEGRPTRREHGLTSTRRGSYPAIQRASGRTIQGLRE